MGTAMNRYQRILLALATLNALLMVLLPPFNNVPLARGALPTFAGFYPLLTQFGRQPVHDILLFLELSLLTINALAAFLALQHRGDHEIPRFRYSRGIALFVAANLALVLLFPPFEPYSGLTAGGHGTFDSFYFVFGDRSHRAIFAPLLHLECLFVLVNAFTLWLLFNAIARSDEATRRKIIHLAEDLPDEALKELAHELEHRAEAHMAAHHTDHGHGEKHHG